MDIRLEKIADPALHILVIVLLALTLNWIVRRLLYRLARRARERAGIEVGARAATIIETTVSLAKYAIFFAATFMILSQAGFNIATLLAGAGVVGLAIGFGAQSLVRDVVSGFFILMEGQYGVGDVVEINSVLGTVEEVGLRLTRLRDIRGQIYFFPNGAITTVNAFPRPGPEYIIHVPIAADHAEAAQKVLTAALADFNDEFGAFAENPLVVGKKELSTYANLLVVSARLQPFRQAVTLDKLAARLSSAFQRAGYALPDGTEISILPSLRKQLP